MRFRADAGGTISGIRFYKAAANTGHARRQPLDQQRRAAGDRDLHRRDRLGLAAGELRDAGRHRGRHDLRGVVSHQHGKLRHHRQAPSPSAGVDSPPLHALATGVDGANGVYLYGASAFPTQTFNATNYWVDVVYNTGAPDTTPPTVVSVTPAAGATGVGVSAAATATFSEAMNAATITTSTVVLRNPGNVIVSSTVGYNSGTNVVTLTPTAALAASTTYTATIAGGSGGVKDLAGQRAGEQLRLVVHDRERTDLSVHHLERRSRAGADRGRLECRGAGRAVPRRRRRQHHGRALLQGGGQHRHARRQPLDQQRRAAGDGDLQRRDASGWQQVTFGTPVSIAANTTYVASYHTNTGSYGITGGAFTSAGVDNAPLHALATGVDGANGVYLYGGGAFPTQTFNAANYWVDVVYSAGPPDTTPPTVLERHARRGGDRREPVRGRDGDLQRGDERGDDHDEHGRSAQSEQRRRQQHRRIQRGHQRRHADADGLAGRIHHLHGDDHGRERRRERRLRQCAGDQLRLVVHDGERTDLSVHHLERGGRAGADRDRDSSAVELGVRFRADMNGHVTGVRFYKGATNTGTHVGSLWTNTGTLLATATFIGETASGWQQVAFSTPVAITANTTYVVSYHTNTGNYGFDGAYFASAGVDNAPLHALATGVDGANGVYLYGASAFPTSSFNATNYWVDVVFAQP